MSQERGELLQKAGTNEEPKAGRAPSACVQFRNFLSTISVQDWRLDHFQMAQSILELISLMENKYSTSGEICKLWTWMAKRIPSLGRVLHRQKAAHQDSVEGPAVQQAEDKTR